jgi:lysophospholipase L1-like esterase
MTNITTRAAVGRPLTYAEMDGNFNNLNSGKAEVSVTDGLEQKTTILTKSIAATSQQVAGYSEDSGSSQIGFIQSGAGAVGLTVQEELRDRLSVKQFGAKGDGITDDTASINPASVVKGDVSEYVVTAFPDVHGRDLMPGGVAHNHTSGRVYNPQQQQTLPAFGKETLQHWFDKFAGSSTKNSGDTTIRSIVISGDSTTYGVGATYGTPTSLLEDAAEQRGYTNVGVINRGQSGKATFDWISTYLDGDLAANPDLLILRWGANDPYFGRTVDDFISDLRTGLARVRAAKDVGQLSILLMTPTSMNDVEKGRTQVWSERIGPAIRQAARDFQCAFIDTYSQLQNSHDAAGIWMDSDTSFHTPGRAIHPHDIMYEHIVGLICDTIFPNYGLNWKVNSIRNQSAGDAPTEKEGTEPPETYFSGITMHRLAVLAGTPDGRPYNGIGMMLKQADGAGLRISFPLLDGSSGSGISMQLCWQNKWSAWYGGTNNGASILQSGWANTGGAFQQFIYQLTLEGRVCLNGVINAGTTTDGTIICVLPTGFRPRANEILLVASENATCRLLIDVNGVIKIYGFGSGGGYISLSGVSFRAGLN